MMGICFVWLRAQHREKPCPDDDLRFWQRGGGGKQLDCGLFVDSVAAKGKQNAVAAFMEMRGWGGPCVLTWLFRRVSIFITRKKRGRRLGLV